LDKTCKSDRGPHSLVAVLSMGFFKLVVAAAFVCVAISTAQVGARTFDAEEPGHPPRAIGRVIGRLLKKLLGRPVARALSRGNATRRSRRGSPQRKGLIVTPDVPIMAQDPESNSCWAYARASALFSTGALDKCMPLAFKAKYVYDFNYDALDIDENLDDAWQGGVGEKELGEKMKRDFPSVWAMRTDVMSVAETIYDKAGRKPGSVIASKDNPQDSFWPLKEVVESKGIYTPYQWCHVYNAVKEGKTVTLALIAKKGCTLKHFVTVLGMKSKNGQFPECTGTSPLDGITFLANDPWCPDAVEAFTSQEDDLKYLGHCKTQKDSNLLLEREPDPNPQLGKLCTFAKGNKTSSALSDHPCIPEITIMTGPVDALHGDANYEGWQDDDKVWHYGCRDEDNEFAKELRRRYQQKQNVLIAEGLLYNVQKKAIIWEIHAFRERSFAERRCAAELAKRYKDDTYIPKKKNEDNPVQSKIATQGEKEGKEILLLDGVDLDKTRVKKHVKKAVMGKLKTGSSLPAIHDSKTKSAGTPKETKSKGNVTLPKMKKS